MATGTELILGFAHPRLHDVAADIGLTVDFREGDIGPDKIIETLNKGLEKAWSRCLRTDLGLVLTKAKVEYQTGHKPEGRWMICKSQRAKDAVADTSTFVFTGKSGDKIEDHFQEASPFGLGFYYDPDEMGDRPEDAVLGVSLITRYYPCFLDLDSPHGGSGEMIRLNADVLSKIEVARKAVMTVCPQWKDAEIIIKELFY